MSKMLAVLTGLIMLINQSDIYDLMWFNSTDEVRYNFPICIKAHAAGMTDTEYEYLARVIEAESDRTDSMDGKIYIAAVIINRVNDDRFPDSIEGVLNESGQFSTTSGGWCMTNYTQTSCWAVIEAQRALADGSIPDNLLYFNCIGYNMTGYCIPYDYIDGNYFMTA